MRTSIEAEEELAENRTEGNIIVEISNTNWAPCKM